MAIRQHNDPEEVFLCDCGSLGHATRLWYMRPDRDDTDEIYFTILLDNWRNLWQRFVVGLKFAFGKEPKDGVYQPVALRHCDMPRLMKLLSEQVGDKVELLPPQMMPVVGDYYELRIARSDWTYDGDVTPELTVEVHFKRNLTLLQRLSSAAHFFLARSKRYGSEDCFSLSPADSVRLKGIAKQFFEAA